MSLILVMFTAGHAISTEQMCRQILDQPFQVISCGFNGSLPGLTKSISGRVSLEYIFRVYTHTRGILRSFPNTYLR